MAGRNIKMVHKLLETSCDRIILVHVNAGVFRADSPRTSTKGGCFASRTVGFCSRRLNHDPEDSLGCKTRRSWEYHEHVNCVTPESSIDTNME